MINVYLILSNNGDGSSSIKWFRNPTGEQLNSLEESDPERWSSGDGLQYEHLVFPDEFDFEAIGVPKWKWYDFEEADLCK